MSPEQSDPFGPVARDLVAALRGVRDDTPERQRKRAVKALAPLLEELLVKHRIGRDTPEDGIRERWAEIVGPAIAHYSHAAQIDPRGRLVVIYNQPVAGNELRFHQAVILQRVRAVPGCGHIGALIIRAG